MILRRYLPRHRLTALTLLAALAATAAPAAPARLLRLRQEPAGEIVPFDPSVRQLPPRYRGTDLGGLAAAIRAREQKLVKDEFETTAQFRERTEAERAKPLHGTLRANSLLAAVLPVDASYDADRAVMTVAATTGAPLPFTLARRTFEAEIAMDIPRARRAKPELRALVVFSLAEARPMSEGIPGVVRAVWFFDQSTGEVFAKKGPGEWVEGVSLKQAQRLISEGKDEEALSELRSAVRNKPNDAEAYLLTGRIYLRRGETASAINQFKTAIFWDKSLVEPHLLLARIYLERGDLSQARAYVQSALKIDPNNPEAADLQRRLR